MIVTDDKQLTGLRKVGQLVAQTLQSMQQFAEPGMTTAELDALASALFDRAGARSAPQLCYGFPGATCISVNEEAAHGIPGPRVLQSGDLINIDVSAEIDGYFADTGGSFILGNDPEPTRQTLKRRLCHAALGARDTGIAHARSGQRLNTLGRHIENSVRAAGFRNVRNLCGHGTGQHLHEEPTVRNYHDQRDGQLLVAGQVLTIEPFLSTNVSQVREAEDGWTLLGRPSSLFAQYEHTLVITDGAPLILTMP